MISVGQKCNTDKLKQDWNDYGYSYNSFVEMRPYLGSTICIKETIIYVAGDSSYNIEHIEQMSSVAYLWRDGSIVILNANADDSQIRAEDFQPILNSPAILQCQNLVMETMYFSFKDYKILYTVKVIETYCYDQRDIDLWHQYWQEFLEQPEVKPVIVFRDLYIESINKLLNQIYKAFTSAVLPNAFVIVFSQFYGETFTEFRETNETSGEILELKKGLPVEWQKEYLEDYCNYTLERI
ncbi:hypothetical protein DdX_18908 [Ditylenchus destructor]|uniref:Uncharacterized protein n=1 Tax=Ditylenchus destructor TaxID=166010 RepID=A0AAD4MP51_9BILA|nr:hypothetical protein DdX_18908 [Ditylenchus destructor]